MSGPLLGYIVRGGYGNNTDEPMAVARSRDAIINARDRMIGLRDDVIRDCQDHSDMRAAMLTIRTTSIDALNTLVVMLSELEAAQRGGV